ncbi:MAG: hypothetical protein HY400_05040 [Elusimicrobia bacterium]|nr:hypothetical protein [Elusimicrobiota bacterium]
MQMDLQKAADESGEVVAVYWLKGDRTLAQKLPIETVPGKLLYILELAQREYEVAILYPLDLFSQDVSSWLSIIFGGISIHPALYWKDAYWPRSFRMRFKGPRWGMSGIREALFLAKQPLFMGILKNFHNRSLADIKRDMLEFGMGGADILVEDEKMADLSRCPFEARLELGLQAVAEVEKRTGRKMIYAPNIGDRPDRMVRKLEKVISMKGRAVAVQPYAYGLGTLSLAAEILDGRAAILAQGAFAGPWLKQISPELVLGSLPRLCGADGVLCPGSEGDFRLGREKLEKISFRLRQPVEGWRSSCIFLAVSRIPEDIDEVLEFLGGDFGFACPVGGSEQGEGGRVEAKQIREAILKSIARKMGSSGFYVAGS